MLAKLEDVTRLMANLTADLQHMNLLPHRMYAYSYRQLA